MTAAEKRECARMDAEFRGHRPLPPGRNFTCWEHVESEENRQNYRNGYDAIRWDVEKRLCPTEQELAVIR